MTVIRFPLAARPAAQGLSPTAGEDPLGAFIDVTNGMVLEALADLETASGYQAIAQLSGHLATMRRVVYPAAVRWLHVDPWLPAAFIAAAREAEWALRLFECCLSGEASAASLQIDTVQAALEQRLGSYRSVERMLLAQLKKRMPVQERRRIAGDYRVVATAAPTRPHPRGPHLGPLGGLAFRFHSFWDRVLDTADSRPGRLLP